MTSRTAMVVIALAFFAAACSGDDDAPPSTSSISSPASTSGPEPQPSTTVPGSTTAPVPSTTVADEVEPTIEVATINVLHGLSFASGCAEHTDQCLAPTRIDILWDYLDTQTGCPEIIALQEISARQQEIVPEKLPDLCDGEHVLLTENLGLPDQEMILTTLPIIDERRVELAGAPTWSAHWAQLDAGDSGIVDVFATHFASSSFNLPCDPSEPVTTCSAACPEGSLLGDCHPYETLEFLEANAAPESLELVIGDLNKPIDDPRIATLTDAGFIDTYLEAGLPECDETTSVGCTSGIGGETELDGLDIAEQSPGSRIDFILARPPDGCSLVVDTDDSDGDRTPTGHWANAPLSEPIEGLFWAADHVGIVADVGVDCL